MTTNCWNSAGTNLLQVSYKLCVFIRVYITFSLDAFVQLPENFIGKFPKIIFMISDVFLIIIDYKLALLYVVLLPAVDHCWSSFSLMVRLELSSECQDLCWVERNAEVWPRYKVQMLDF